MKGGKREAKGGRKEGKGGKGREKCAEKGQYANRRYMRRRGREGEVKGRGKGRGEEKREGLYTTDNPPSLSFPFLPFPSLSSP